jgi:hypothetical protein
MRRPVTYPWQAAYVFAILDTDESKMRSGSSCRLEVR